MAKRDTAAKTRATAIYISIDLLAIEDAKDFLDKTDAEIKEEVYIEFNGVGKVFTFDEMKALVR